MGSLVHALLTSYAASGQIIDVLDPLGDSFCGGGRAAFLGLVQELPKFGHEVHAFSTFKEKVRKDGVTYIPIDQYNDDLRSNGVPNVLWATYDTRPLSGRHGMLRIASHHTYRIDCIGAPWEYIDINTIPSQAALDFLKPYCAPWSDWRILPNSIGDVPEWKPVSGRVVYHTSATRGLHILLHAWPEIKARVPHATLHVISDYAGWMNNLLTKLGVENSEDGRRARLIQEGFVLARKAGGVEHFANLSRAQLHHELSQASMFAFPCTPLSPCETFSASVMECCKIGIPVVLAPSDALESIYRHHVLMTPAPVEKYTRDFIDGVVQMLKDQDVANYYSQKGKELASGFTFERGGKVLNDMICQNTGFVPNIRTVNVTSKTPETKIISAPTSHKKIAFLLDPWACTRPLNPETLFTDPRGLTGSEITNLMHAIEMSKHGHDVTMYSNFTHNHQGHGIHFVKWDRWGADAKHDWYAAVATIHPGGLEYMNNGPLKIFNQQVNDFGYCVGWEQYVDKVTALSHAHQRHLLQSSSFKDWTVLPNGCDPSVYYEFPRNNRKMVYASSPDRGLHWLLELFPRLKKRVSDAECHVYYHLQDGVIDTYERIGEKELANRYRYIEKTIDKMKDHGVVHHKSVSRRQMVKVLSESRILAYTCDPVRFTEGFSCTTLEAAVSGCLPVICGTDALSEIYGDFCPVTPAPYKDNKNHYFENLIKYLTDDDAYKVAQKRAKEMAKTHSWSEVSKQLRSLMSLA
jgi:glycosyltransferase involved in cell wall biosynthesis